MSGCAGTAVADESLTPVCLSTTRKHAKWNPVNVSDCCITITGGFNRTPSVAPSVQYTQGHKQHTFVELNKNAPWFLKEVGGSDIQKGDLKPVQVLHDLRAKYNDAYAAAVAADEDAAVAEHNAIEVDGDKNAAVAGHDANGVAGDEDDDPMNALDDLVTSTHKATPTPKAAVRTKQRPDRAEMKFIAVPTRAPCVVCDHFATTLVCVYRKPGPRNNTRLYLRVDCLDWLLSYAADELHYQGVTRIDPEPNDQEPNCDAVADLHLAWDFNERQWVATFVAGQFAGVTKRFGAKDITPQQWSAMRMTMKTSGRDLARTPLIEGKAATKEFIIMWCAAIVNNTGDAFKEEWQLDLDETTFETPEKKRHSDDVTCAAVADA